MPEITIKYPDGYNDYPNFVDHATKVDAQWLNGTGFAYHSITYTLGLNPEGTFDTVRARLDWIETQLGPPPQDYVPKSGGNFEGHVGFNYYRAEYAYLHSIGSLNFKDEAVKVETIKDEDYLSSNSDKALATQQSIKSFVDKRWEKVYENKLTSPATNIVLTNWDNGESVNGDEDCIYMFQLFFKSNYDGSNSCLIRFNNDSGGNYRRAYSRTGQSGVDAVFGSGLTGLDILYTNGIGEFSLLDGIFYACSGNPRLFNFRTVWANQGPGIAEVWAGCAMWENSANNIISISFNSSQSNGFAIGTHLIIFKGKA